MFSHKYTLLACLSIAISCFSSTLMASVYKCLDENNKVYFSDRQCDAEQKQMEIEIRNDPVAPTKNKSNQSWRRVLQIREMERMEKKEEKLRRTEKKKAQQQAQCEYDMKRLAKLNSRVCEENRSQRSCTIYALVKYDKDGNKIIESEHKKQAEIKRLEASIKKNCK